MEFIKQSTAADVLIGPFVDDTDGKTAETGLTISQADVRLSKNAGNMAQKNESTAATHDELGYYSCPLDTTDTATLGRLQVMVHESGALPVWHEFTVLPAATYDSLIAGTDKLPVDVQEVSSDSTAADNLELMFDGTGYAGGTAKLSVNAAQIEGADPTDTIRDAVVDDATRIDASALNTLAGHDPGATIGTGTSTLTAQQVWEYGTRTLSSFGTLAADTTTAVWAAVARTLTDKADFTLHSDYDAAKSAAPVGAEMDLKDAPNATAITAIQSGLSTFDEGSDTVTVGTNNDKTGYALSVAGIAAIWNALTSGLTTVGSVGKLLVDNVNATISSRGTLTAQQVWEYGTRTVSSYGTLVADTATAVWSAVARTLTDKTGYALTDAYDDAKTAAQAGDAMTLTEAYDAAKSAAPAGAEMDLVDAPNSTAVAALQSGLSTHSAAQAAAAVAGVDLAGYEATAKSATTLGAMIAAARAAGAGKLVISGTTLTLYEVDGTTAVLTYTLDDADTPTARSKPA